MLIISEIGQAHEGSLGIAHSYIDALAKTGITAIKWQTHIAEAESSSSESFRVKFSFEDKTRYDYWKRMEFSREEWQGLKDHCEDCQLEFISSPFSLAAVDLLEELNVKRYKIGSGEVNNYLFLDKIAKTHKPIILSSGMSSFTELDRTIEFLNSYGNELSILQCTTNYPTKAGEWGLNVIEQLRERYNLPVGFSDHSGNIYACLAAVSLGAEILEFHTVFDKRMFGPDSRASLTIDEIKILVEGVNEIKIALNSPVNKADNSKFESLKQIFEKSLSVNRSLKKGDEIKLEFLEAKKPKNCGINASDYQAVIGKTLVNDLEKWSFLTNGDIE